MPGLIKDQRCSDGLSSAPSVGSTECCMQRVLSSVTALPVLLCCPTLTKRTVKWLFQSPHSSDVGGQLISCTSRNRKCVKRHLLPPPWLYCVPAKLLWLHFHRIIESKPSLIIKVAIVIITVFMHLCL